MEDKELVERAVRNAKARKTGKHVRWAAVVDTFGVGSTSAIALCRRFDVDPEKMVSGAICLACNP